MVILELSFRLNFRFRLGKYKMSLKKTTEEFVAEARKIHGDRYDYSKAKYKKCRFQG